MTYPQSCDRWRSPGGVGVLSPTVGLVTTGAGDPRRMQFAVNYVF